MQFLRNTFEKEADCDVDWTVSSSDRERARSTSNDVMRLAAFPTMKATCVTPDIDADVTSYDLIVLLKELGAKTKSERNPNLSFLLPNDTRFLNGKESIPDVALEAQSSAMKITFPDAKPIPSSKEKPNAKKDDRRRNNGRDEERYNGNVHRRYCGRNDNDNGRREE